MGFYEHIKTIHEGVRYQCDTCEKSFTQLYNLKKHMKQVHEKEYVYQQQQEQQS